MPLPTALTIMGCAKESVLFTAVAPTTSDQFFAVMNPKPSDEADMVLDTGYRGLMTKDYGDFQSFRQGKWSWEMFAYPIPLGTVLMGIFGTDGFAAGTTHPFTIAAGLTPSYTISDYYGVSGSSTRQYTGHYFESVTLSYASTGQLKVACTTVGRSSVPAGLAAKPTTAYDSSAPLLPYENALTLNGGSNTKLVALDLKLARPVEVIFGANNTQDPTAVNVGPLEVTGKMTFVPTDDTELNFYENATALTTNTFVFTSGGTTLTINIDAIRMEKGTVVDRGTPYVKVAANFRGIYSAADSGVAKCTLVGGKSAAAY